LVDVFEKHGSTQIIIKRYFFFNLVKINRGLFKNFYFAYVMFKDATQGMVAA